MRILHITPEAPDYHSGGSIVVYQTMNSLKNNGHIIDYCGPEICDELIESNYNNLFYLKECQNNLLRIIDYLFGNTSIFYRSWRDKEIIYDDYGLIFLEFTKLSFVLDKIRGRKLFVRLHNVEKDYADIQYELGRNIEHWLYRRHASSKEKKILNSADGVLALTCKDKQRVEHLYGIDDNKIAVIPVCISEKKNAGNIHKSDWCNVTLLITGSLWYESNFRGITWFIENVYKNHLSHMKLIVAGRKPTEELKHLISQFENIQLIDSPADMSPYFCEADLAIAPVFAGAGMKVKVAEALSYGVPVVGTDHAFIGYDIVDGNNSYIANREEEFCHKVISYERSSQEEKIKTHIGAFNLFLENYSIAKSTIMYGETINKTISRSSGERLHSK